MYKTVKISFIIFLLILCVEALFQLEVSLQTPHESTVINEKLPNVLFVGDSVLRDLPEMMQKNCNVNFNIIKVINAYFNPNEFSTSIEHYHSKYSPLLTVSMYGLFDFSGRRRANQYLSNSSFFNKSIFLNYLNSKLNFNRLFSIDSSPVPLVEKPPEYWTKYFNNVFKKNLSEKDVEQVFILNFLKPNMYKNIENHFEVVTILSALREEFINRKLIEEGIVFFESLYKYFNEQYKNQILYVENIKNTDVINWDDLLAKLVFYNKLKASSYIRYIQLNTQLFKIPQLNKLISYDGQENWRIISNKLQLAKIINNKSFVDEMYSFANEKYLPSYIELSKDIILKLSKNSMFTVNEINSNILANKEHIFVLINYLKNSKIEVTEEFIIKNIDQWIYGTDSLKTGLNQTISYNTSRDQKAIKIEFLNNLSHILNTNKSKVEKLSQNQKNIVESYKRNLGLYTNNNYLLILQYLGLDSKYLKQYFDTYSNINVWALDDVLKDEIENKNYDEIFIDSISNESGHMRSAIKKSLSIRLCSHLKSLIR
ncbi:MAG: hypothetical protein H6625_05790 [Bdellovibrionaceae bacterium]|nr:hypothetical protein [Pseudobdellovibrionaceae bacterium]